jgi:hypothetical protein
VRILTISALLIFASVAARAQVTTDNEVTLLATGTVVPFLGNFPVGSLGGQELKVGDTLQLEYTINPSIPSTVNGGPVVALSYSFNGAPFTNFFGTEFGDFAGAVAGGAGGSYGFELQPSHGTEVFLNVSLGQGAPAGIIPSSNLNVIPNWSLVAGAPLGSVTATAFIEDLTGSGAEADITNIKQVGAVSAPEIDPAGLVSGLTLLLGGIAVLQGKRRTPSNGVHA